MKLAFGLLAALCALVVVGIVGWFAAGCRIEPAYQSRIVIACAAWPAWRLAL